MGNSLYFVMAFVTLVLSIVVVLMALTRLHCGECKRGRLKYTVVLLAALTAGLQPYFFNQLPGISNVLLVLTILWLLMDGALSFKEHKSVHAHRHFEVKDEVMDKSK